MTKSATVFALAGSSLVVAAVVTLYVFRRKGTNSKDKKTNQTQKSAPRQRLVSFRCTQDLDGSTENSPDVVPITRPRNLFNTENMNASADDKDNPPSSDSSYTSLDDDSSVTQRTDSSNNAESASSEDSTSVAGAVGCSTYTRRHGDDVIEKDFNELLGSPIIDPVLANVQDERMIRDTPPTMDSIVADYGTPTSPSVVDTRYHSIYDGYHRIVPPLQPNTGATIPTPTSTSGREEFPVNFCMSVSTP